MDYDTSTSLLLRVTEAISNFLGAVLSGQRRKFLGGYQAAASAAG